MQWRDCDTSPLFTAAPPMGEERLNKLFSVTGLLQIDQLPTRPTVRPSFSLHLPDMFRRSSPSRYSPTFTQRYSPRDTCLKWMMLYRAGPSPLWSNLKRSPLSPGMRSLIQLMAEREPRNASGMVFGKRNYNVGCGCILFSLSIQLQHVLSGQCN